ncbi:MAG: efflux RND transporter periplasmic adaptor subunit [Xanthomonadales bacterium]|nr:efflux RND transporter periplasmic adaptor subunit [Xanthomonadales bacterium]MBP6078450.1 efflux RND transporter periplasmic adaptor subunit [Xanthomonadales bacterium]
MSLPARLSVAALVSLFVLVAAGCGGSGKPLEPAKPAIVVKPIPLEAMAIETYAGDVRARVQSTLGFRVAGKIDKRLVDVGARVRKGQALATLVPDDLNLQVSAYEAAVASAEANLALADAELERHRQLLDRKYISQALFDARANQQKAAAAGLEQARAQLEVARNQTTYTQLAADASGVITQIMAEVGQVVSPGQPVAALAHEGELEVAIDVPESRVGEFKPGRVVIAEMWAASGKRYPATIREVSPQADPATRTNAVKVAFDAPDGDVQLGRTARIFLTDAARASSVLVPLSAVHEKDGKPAVYIVDAKTKQVALREVTLGVYREDGATVTGGLAATDWVVANGVHKLQPGQAIKPIDRDNRPVTL